MAAKVGRDAGVAKSLKAGGWAALDATAEHTAQVMAAAQALLASDLSSDLNNLVAAAVKGSATIYDKAMDANYLDPLLRPGLGGSYHRLFDGGHTIAGAVRAARDASSDDTVIEEARGTVQALLRDAATPRGLPVATWDKGTFDAVADSRESTFAIPKSGEHPPNRGDIVYEETLCHSHDVQFRVWVSHADDLSKPCCIPATGRAKPCAPASHEAGLGVSRGMRATDRECSPCTRQRKAPPVHHRRSGGGRRGGLGT